MVNIKRNLELKISILCLQKSSGDFWPKKIKKKLIKIQQPSKALNNKTPKMKIKKSLK